MAVKKGLGKGLGALLEEADYKPSEGQEVMELKIGEVSPNSNQPRQTFDDVKLSELASSIKKHGIMQPLIVKREGSKYLIVAGERRWRAAKLAGLKSVPAIIRELTSREVMEMALIENIQREDLNPIEEADAYDKLMTEFGLTQEQLAETVGKSRPAIANTVRLLLLAEGVKRMIADGSLTSGHARALLGVSDKTKQEEAAAHIVERGFSVRQTEELVKKLSVAQKPAKKKKGKKSTPEIAQLENKLKTYLGTKVRLDAIDQKKGKIVIEYYSLDDIDRIVGLIMKD